MEPREGTTERVTEPTRTTLGGRRCAMRVLQDERQGMVLVYELEPAAGDASPRALVFESGKSCIRLEHYPPEWRRMGQDELLALRRGQS